MVEAIRKALFPQNDESPEAQYAAQELWQVMQKIPILAETSPHGLLQKGSARLEDFLYGHFPKFSASAIGLKRRIALWVGKASMSEKGQDILRAIEIDRPGPGSGRDRFSIDDADSIGEAVAEMFMLRLEVPRAADPDIELARIWLKEQIRKTDIAALAVERRVDTEVTRAFEGGSAITIGTAASYTVDALGYHGVQATLAGGAAALAAYLGGSILLRRRPLLPRQVGLRLYVLQVICQFLSKILGSDIDFTVPSAKSALRQIRTYQWFLQAGPAEDLQRKSLSSGTELGSSDDQHRVVVEVTDILEEWSGRTADSDRLAWLRATTERLTDLAGQVNDHLVQAHLIQLEAAVRTAGSVDDVFDALERVLDSLSH